MTETGKMDTDELRYIARVSNLCKESCQVCEDAAEEIDKLHHTLLDYADERDEAVALLRAALKFVLEPSTVNVHSIDFVGSRDDLARCIDALLQRVGGSHE